MGQVRKTLDGSREIEFPDTMSDAEIDAEMAKLNAQIPVKAGGSSILGDLLEGQKTYWGNLWQGIKENKGWPATKIAEQFVTPEDKAYPYVMGPARTIEKYATPQTVLAATALAPLAASPAGPLVMPLLALPGVTEAINRIPEIQQIQDPVERRTQQVEAGTDIAAQALPSVFSQLMQRPPSPGTAVVPTGWRRVPPPSPGLPPGAQPARPPVPRGQLPLRPIPRPPPGPPVPAPPPIAPPAAPAPTGLPPLREVVPPLPRPLAPPPAPPGPLETIPPAPGPPPPGPAPITPTPEPPASPDAAIRQYLRDQGIDIPEGEPITIGGEAVSRRQGRAKGGLTLEQLNQARAAQGLPPLSEAEAARGIQRQFRGDLPEEEELPALPSGIAGGRYKHFTTPESKAALERGEAFDFTRPPQHGTGDLGLGPKTGRMAEGEFIYLSMDDPAWSKVMREKEGGRIAEIPKEGEMEGVPFYDYDQQKWMQKIGGYEDIKLEGVDFDLDPGTRVLTIDSVDALRQAMRSVNRNYDTPEFWSELSKNYDAVAIKNVRRNIDETDHKFFRSAKADQIVVLNRNVAKPVRPPAPLPQPFRPGLGPAREQAPMVPTSRMLPAPPPPPPPPPFRGYTGPGPQAIPPPEQQVYPKLPPPFVGYRGPGPETIPPPERQVYPPPPPPPPPAPPAPTGDMALSGRELMAKYSPTQIAKLINQGKIKRSQFKPEQLKEMGISAARRPSGYDPDKSALNVIRNAGGFDWKARAIGEVAKKGRRTDYSTDFRASFSFGEQKGLFPKQSGKVAWDELGLVMSEAGWGDYPAEFWDEYFQNPQKRKMTRDEFLGQAGTGVADFERQQEAWDEAQRELEYLRGEVERLKRGEAPAPSKIEPPDYVKPFRDLEAEQNLPKKPEPTDEELDELFGLGEEPPPEEPPTGGTGSVGGMQVGPVQKMLGLGEPEVPAEQKGKLALPPQKAAPVAPAKPAEQRGLFAKPEVPAPLRPPGPPPVQPKEQRGLFGPETATKPEGPTRTPKVKTAEEDLAASIAAEKPGLGSQDIYKDFEKQGFEVEKIQPQAEYEIALRRLRLDTADRLSRKLGTSFKEALDLIDKYDENAWGWFQKAGMAGEKAVRPAYTRYLKEKAEPPDREVELGRQERQAANRKRTIDSILDNYRIDYSNALWRKGIGDIGATERANNALKTLGLKEEERMQLISNVSVKAENEYKAIQKAKTPSTPRKITPLEVGMDVHWQTMFGQWFKGVVRAIDGEKITVDRTVPSGAAGIEMPKDRLTWEGGPILGEKPATPPGQVPPGPPPWKGYKGPRPPEPGPPPSKVERPAPEPPRPPGKPPGELEGLSEDELSALDRRLQDEWDRVPESQRDPIRERLRAVTREKRRRREAGYYEPKPEPSGLDPLTKLAVEMEQLGASQKATAREEYQKQIMKGGAKGALSPRELLGLEKPKKKKEVGPLFKEEPPPGLFGPPEPEPTGGANPKRADQLVVGDRIFTTQYGYQTVEKVYPKDPRYPNAVRVDLSRELNKQFDADKVLNVESKSLGAAEVGPPKPHQKELPFFEKKQPDLSEFHKRQREIIQKRAMDELVEINERLHKTGDLSAKDTERMAELSRRWRMATGKNPDSTEVMKQFSQALRGRLKHWLDEPDLLRDILQGRNVGFERRTEQRPFEAPEKRKGERRESRRVTVPPFRLITEKLERLAPVKRLADLGAELAGLQKLPQRTTEQNIRYLKLQKEIKALQDEIKSGPPKKPPGQVKPFPKEKLPKVTYTIKKVGDTVEVWSQDTETGERRRDRVFEGKDAKEKAGKFIKFWQERFSPKKPPEGPGPGSLGAAGGAPRKPHQPFLPTKATPTLSIEDKRQALDFKIRMVAQRHVKAMQAGDERTAKALKQEVDGLIEKREELGTPSELRHLPFNRQSDIIAKRLRNARAEYDKTAEEFTQEEQEEVRLMQRDEYEAQIREGKLPPYKDSWINTPQGVKYKNWERKMDLARKKVLDLEQKQKDLHAGRTGVPILGSERQIKAIKNAVDIVRKIEMISAMEAERTAIRNKPAERDKLWSDITERRIALKKEWDRLRVEEGLEATDVLDAFDVRMRRLDELMRKVRDAGDEEAAKEYEDRIAHMRYERRELVGEARKEWKFVPTMHVGEDKPFWHGTGPRESISILKNQGTLKGRLSGWGGAGGARAGKMPMAGGIVPQISWMGEDITKDPLVFVSPHPGTPWRYGKAKTAFDVLGQFTRSPHGYMLESGPPFVILEGRIPEGTKIYHGIPRNKEVRNKQKGKRFPEVVVKHEIPNFVRKVQIAPEVILDADGQELIAVATELGYPIEVISTRGERYNPKKSHEPMQWRQEAAQREFSRVAQGKAPIDQLIKADLASIANRKGISEKAKKIAKKLEKLQFQSEYFSTNPEIAARLEKIQRQVRPTTAKQKDIQEQILDLHEQLMKELPEQKVFSPEEEEFFGQEVGYREFPFAHKSDAEILDYAEAIMNDVIAIREKPTFEDFDRAFLRMNQEALSEIYEGFVLSRRYRYQTKEKPKEDPAYLEREDKVFARMLVILSSLERQLGSGESWIRTKSK